VAWLLLDVGMVQIQKGVAMQHQRIVHVVGTGTIGEPLIGLLASFRKELGIDEVTFHNAHRF
jgi:hypothetical protein